MQKFNNKYDVPELAGYSVDGKTFYVDRHMPRFMFHNGKKIDTYKYLLIHETTEFTLRTQLGFSYNHAHELATIAEWWQFIKDNGEIYKAYNDFCQKYVKLTEDESKRDIPPDLENPWTGRAYTLADLKIKYARSAIRAAHGMLQD